MDSNGLHSTPKVSLTNQISWQLLARFGTALLVVSATAGPSLGRHGTAPPSHVGLQHIHPKPPCYDKQVCVVLLCYMLYHFVVHLLQLFGTATRTSLVLAIVLLWAPKHCALATCDSQSNFTPAVVLKGYSYGLCTYLKICSPKAIRKISAAVDGGPHSPSLGQKPKYKVWFF